MKNVFKTIFVLLIFGTSVQAQERINVIEDAYIQGGETVNAALGKTDPLKLMIANSDLGNKYARTSFLKFELPRNIKSAVYIALNVNLKVFQSKDKPNDVLNLEIYSIEDSSWNENEITAFSAPKLGTLLGVSLIPQSNKDGLYTVELKADEFKKLAKDSKKNTITLALVSTKNTISAMAATKEKSLKDSAYLSFE
ncbi:CBM96 family carbohydrate-binding protein [Flavobacterium sp. WC2509]|uniref:CBM96 family carbohydrate-binding protein n=1 Tax=Flavobacterium sp. WC2509 TaxID=3461406 RepID=UPI004043A388